MANKPPANERPTRSSGVGGTIFIHLEPSCPEDYIEVVNELFQPFSM